MPENKLGSVKLTGKKSVVAGSFATFKLTYTAGSAGIDDRGSIKIAFRDMCDAGELQWTDPKGPDYVWSRASGDARLEPSRRGHIRPWRKGLTLKVMDGFLRPAEKIVVVFGDTSKGSPGWRVQTFCEGTFEFRVLVDPHGTGVYEPLDDCPEIRITPGQPARLVAVAPTLMGVGQPFEVALKTEDLWGNPVGRVRRIKRKGFRKPGTYVLPFHDAKTGLTCETNPIVVEEHVELGRWWADFHAQSEETIGTNSVEEYFAFAREKAFLDIASHQGNDFQVTDDFWARLNRVTRASNVRGKFVTFPGYEWSGNTGVGGDRNVLFRREQEPISRSSRVLISDADASFPDSPTADDLFRLMKDRECLIFAHVGGRFADLDFHMEGIEFGVEIHSCWGTAEWLLADALERGYRVGVLGNSDGHKGRPGAEYPGASTFGSRGGLTCVLAERLDRDAVWEALKARHFYATTGPRIFLDVRTDTGAVMGDVVRAEQPPRFLVRAVGTAPIERIEFRSGMDVVRTFRPYGARQLGKRIKLLWEGSSFRGRERTANWDGSVRVKGGRIVGFRSVNFDNPLRACEQIKRNEIRWQSATTGAWAGVILDLGDAGRGTLEIRTAQRDLTVPVKSIGLRPRTLAAGGVGLKLQVYRLPDENLVREMTLPPYRPPRLNRGDNPFYVHVVQEDGQRAWSSPIYVVRR